MGLLESLGYVPKAKADELTAAADHEWAENHFMQNAGHLAPPPDHTPQI